MYHMTKLRALSIGVVVVAIGCSAILLATRLPTTRDNAAVESRSSIEHPTARIPTATSDATRVSHESASPPAGGSGGHAQRSRAEWYAETQRSNDYVQTVRDAAVAAEQGDDGAAREMSVIMLRCALVLRSVRAGQSKEAYLQTYPGASRPAFAEHLNRIYDQCAPLANAGELSDWSTAPGGKGTVSYWRDLALKLGNPATRAEVLVEDMVQTRDATATQRTEAQAKAREYMKDVLRSGDGEALFSIGMRMANSDLASDTTIGPAVALASCDMGYDCTGDNERNDWYACRWQPGCTETMNLAERMKMMMSADQYAQVYARYQEISPLLKSQDWGKLDQLVVLDGSYFR